MVSWPEGFYELPGLSLSLVMLSELPHEDDTIALRLMGARSTFAAAVDELQARFGAVPHGAELLEAVVQIILLAREQLSSESEASMLDVTQARALIKKVRNEGREEGLAPLLHLFSRRIGRALTAEERDIIRARLGDLGADRLGDVVLDLDAAALAAWLSDRDAR